MHTRIGDIYHFDVPYSCSNPARMLCIYIPESVIE